jgi:hypothetical protein
MSNSTNPNKCGTSQSMLPCYQGHHHFAEQEGNRPGLQSTAAGSGWGGATNCQGRGSMESYQVSAWSRILRKLGDKDDWWTAWGEKTDKVLFVLGRIRVWLVLFHTLSKGHICCLAVRSQCSSSPTPSVKHHGRPTCLPSQGGGGQRVLRTQPEPRLGCGSHSHVWMKAMIPAPEFKSGAEALPGSLPEALWKQVQDSGL